jgi:dihydroxy-acid dehydratase
MMLKVIVGCDKTVPAQIMGGISANKPVLPLITGPMSTGSYQGKRIGACTDCRNNWASFRAGQIEIEEIANINEELAPTVSSCLCHFVLTQLTTRRSALAVSWALPAPWHV